MTDELSGATAAETPQDLGGSETVAEAPKPKAVQETKPKAETQETQPSTEEPAGADVSDDDDAETEQEGEQKRPSRNQRLKRKVASLATELDNLAAENERLRSQALQPQRPEQPKQDGQTPPMPKESDFANDYFAFQTALNLWHAERAAERVASQIFQQQQQQRSMSERQSARREAVEQFRERAEEVRERVPDYDKVVQAAKIEIRSDDVMDLIRESDKGPMIAYHLAQKPERIHELNSMSLVEAAKFIGRLEARLSPPTPKTKTQAPPPVNPPKGGAAPAKNFRDLAEKDDITEYVRHRNAERKRA